MIKTWESNKRETANESERTVREMEENNNKKQTKNKNSLNQKKTKNTRKDNDLKASICAETLRKFTKPQAS